MAKVSGSPVPAYFQWIDGMRGAAALIIVIFHYHHFYLADHADRSSLPDTKDFPFANILQIFFDHGYWAVELFWIISGFVFAHVYLPRKATLREFVTARVARLYPLHAITLFYVATLQLASLFTLGHWQVYGNNDLRHFLLNLFMATNLTTQSRGLSFNGPIWSVSMELAAYAFFFIALTGIRRLPVLVPLMCSIVGFSMGAIGPGLPIVRLAIFTCAGYFFAGTVLYGLCARLDWKVVYLLGLCAAACGTVIISWDALNDVVRAILISVSLILFLAACDLMLPSIGGHLRVLGDISYSVYLVHVPLQITLLLAADLFLNGSRAFADSAWLMPVYVFLSIGLALAAHRLIEKPVGSWMRSKLAGKSD
ncbi:hypothetical protein RA27_12495 [Ruegeria sp. ANG-R]|uniref:acyltransferase family protein n=1 Tax=Ruegeria sp. ANG-R TaxID=1577903 RepID=UPI00057F4816|nr:acyltransferase [Ruegeria sp. ANG-R]KIC40590.1 hypothetical protein RA27_12495 [Ruegeria sp. ANG-R]